MEYIIYCDESVSSGKYFSDFYGGALVRSNDYMKIISLLNDKKNMVFTLQALEIYTKRIYSR